MSRISVVVSRTGQQTVTVNGVAGPDCSKLTEFLKKGETIESSAKTSEYYDKPADTQQEARL